MLPPPSGPVDPLKNTPLGRRSLAGYIFLVLIPFIVLSGIFVMFVFVGRPYVVNGSSMLPTLRNGDRVYVVPYRGNTTVDRGDVVVIRDLSGTGDLLIKRTVAIAGDKITVGDEKLVVNDEAVYRSSNQPPAERYSVLVPDDHVFVMGDNESQSFDSRSFGPVPMNNVAGKALLIFWPPGDFGRL